MKTAPRPSALLLPLVALLLAALLAPATARAAAPAEAHWHQDLDAALGAARESDRYLLVDLYAEWCGWCKRMDAQVFSTPAFATFAADYVLLRVDVEDDGEGTWLQQRLGARSLPTLAILAPDLAQVGQVRGFKREPLLTMAVRNQVMSYEAERAELEAGAASGEPRRQLAAAEGLLRRQAGQAAAEAFRRAGTWEGWTPAERLRIAAATADGWRLARDYAAAEAELRRARGLLAASRLDGEAHTAAAELLDVTALRLADELGDCQRLAALESFVHDRAASPLIGEARSRLADVRAEAVGCS